MTNSAKEELSLAKQLHENGDHKKALEIVKALSGREELIIEDRVACLLLESKLRFKFNEFKKALSLIDEALQTARKLENTLLIIDVLITKTELFWRLGEFNMGIQTGKECQELLAKNEFQNEEIEKRKSKLLEAIGINYWYKGEIDKALECYQRSLGFYEKQNDKFGIASVFHNIGILYETKGDLNKAIEYNQKGLNFFEELGKKSGIASSLNNLGNAYKLKGDLNKALEFHQRSLALKKEIGDKRGIALSLLNLGVVSRDQGDLNHAIKYYQQSQEIFEESCDKKNIALALNNLGDVYQLKGDLNLALKHNMQSLAIYEELGIKQDIAMALLNVGEVYRNKKDSKQAQKCYKRSLEIYEGIGNEPLIASVLYELIGLALDTQNIEQTEQYLHKLQLINDRIDNKNVNQRNRVARALSFKSSERTRDKFKAGEILRQVVNEEIHDYSVTITAMIHLCDLLLFELKMTGEEEILDEAKNLINKLSTIANQQSSHLLLAESYLLQSKLALLELDINKAQELLEEALLIAENRGLRKLAIKIFSEKAHFESQIEKWYYLIKHNASLNERLELAQLEELISNVASKRIDVTEEEMKQYALKAKSIVKDWG